MIAGARVASLGVGASRQLPLPGTSGHPAQRAGRTAWGAELAVAGQYPMPAGIMSSWNMPSARLHYTLLETSLGQLNQPGQVQQGAAEVLQQTPADQHQQPALFADLEQPPAQPAGAPERYAALEVLNALKGLLGDLGELHRLTLASVHCATSACSSAGPNCSGSA